MREVTQDECGWKEWRWEEKRKKERRVWYERDGFRCVIGVGGGWQVGWKKIIKKIQLVEKGGSLACNMFHNDQVTSSGRYKYDSGYTERSPPVDISISVQHFLRRGQCRKIPARHQTRKSIGFPRIPIVFHHKLL